MQITFNGSIEKSNQAEIEKYMQPYLWLIPRWGQRIRVTINETDTDTAAMRMRFKYREADLDLNSNWFVRDDLTKRDAIIHELCHNFNYPLWEFADRLIETFVKDEDAAKLLKEENTAYLEGGNQDLTYAILQKFNDERKAAENHKTRR